MQYDSQEKLKEYLIHFGSTQNQNSTGINASCFNLVIEIGQEFAGAIGLIFGKDEKRHCAELGYFLGEEYWGKGYITEAIQLFCDFIFSFIPIVKIESRVYSWNLASSR